MSAPIGRMLMPKATMHKNCLVPRWKYDVWLSRQIRRMQPIAVTHGMDKAAHRHLWFGAPVFNSPHILATATLGNVVRHSINCTPAPLGTLRAAYKLTSALSRVSHQD
jgi:hypothetical protein